MAKTWMCALLVIGAMGWVRGARGEEPPAPAPAPAPAAPAPADPGFVGLELAPAYVLDAEDRKELKLEPTAGIVVMHLVKGAPALLAGARYGDLLVRFGGKALPASEPPADLGDYGAVLEGYERWLKAVRALGVRVTPGAEVELVVKRDGKETALRPVAVDAKTMTALLEAFALELSPDPKPPAPGENVAPARGMSGLNLTAAGLLTPGQRRLLGAVPEVGVVVTAVWAAGPAAAAGIQRGDVIKRIGGRAAPDTTGMDAASPDGEARWKEAFKTFIGEPKVGDEIEIEVERAGVPKTFKVKLADRLVMGRASYVAGQGNRF